MKAATISSQEHGGIEITAEEWHGKVFIECFDVVSLLAHLGQTLTSEQAAMLGEDTFLRGVIIPSEGAFFDLMDQFGVRKVDIINLSAQDAARKVLELINWDILIQ